MEFLFGRSSLMEHLSMSSASSSGRRALGCAAPPEKETVIFSTEDPMVQMYCSDVQFTQCAVWTVPLQNSKLLKVGLEFAKHLHCKVPEDAEHWAFVALAETSHPRMPQVYFVAQYGVVGQEEGSVRFGVCTKDKHYHAAIQNFVGSESDVSLRGDSWTSIQGSVRLNDLVIRASTWQGKPYELFTNNCQNFANDMMMHHCVVPHGDSVPTPMNFAEKVRHHDQIPEGICIPAQFDQVPEGICIPAPFLSTVKESDPAHM